MPRPFYLIGHNPNSVDEAIRCIRAGANAIEPDLYFKDGEFYVNEVIPFVSKIFPPKKGPVLKDYLTDLKHALMADPSLQLALIMWDTKNMDQYNVNDLFAILRQYFINFFPQISVGVTTGDKKYLQCFDTLIAETNQEIAGIDGMCTVDEARHYFESRGLNYMYANGTGVPLWPTTLDRYKHQIMRAVTIRDHPQNHYLRWVYVYTVNNANHIREYLRLNLDGLNTDNVALVKSILQEDEFKNMYQLKDIPVSIHDIPV